VADPPTEGIPYLDRVDGTFDRQPVTSASRGARWPVPRPAADRYQLDSAEGPCGGLGYRRVRRSDSTATGAS
jgi:hypothetical protein